MTTFTVASDEGIGEGEDGHGTGEDARSLHLQIGPFEGREEDESAAFGVGTAAEVDGDPVGRGDGGEGRQVGGHVPPLFGEHAEVLDDDLLRAARLDGVDDLHADDVALIRFQHQRRFHVPREAEIGSYSHWHFIVIFSVGYKLSLCRRLSIFLNFFLTFCPK